ncbi:SusC/RagA family TonB-linked outer membrane protein [Hymenobacter cellulosivorans]|uniref:SusC/RagA family TonB-linked outer membrane protein n=1 Tax=Hymenobacter cellulosivorans TaxID=2932249 RepID=A0ABY4F868_9BACT|nr:SusC/RagA family TonB-linked outer membrane protein [Hymenobacter cellulosivorans]UOQ52854.1 SusC/RagA family TonB-linked outer membrane protein [Hymenobacter cellulosivorans]
MKKLLFMVILLMTSLLQQAIAQDRTISGRVTDQANGQGLPGVTVLVKGTTIGASTGADGSYSLSVPASATTLSFTSIGYTAIERPIGASTSIDVALGTDTKTLGEVVVTALGVERTRNSLAYSATQIESSDITVARNPNAINSLSGKVAGLAITQPNTPGGSSNVVIRGTKSLFGSNQALFVVDGVPISNLNTNSTDQATGRGGYDYGNAAGDLNPDDIASTTVLKGAAATALYGERGSNGVILITTKKGRRGFNVTLNTGVTAGKIDKSTFIKYQDKYGAGYGQYYSSDDGFFNLDADDNLVAPTSEDASYGGRFNPNLLVRQWGSYTPGSPTFGRATPWVAAANGPIDFFETAVSTLNSISLDGGNDMGSFKIGYSNNVERGILPNSRINKDIVNFAGSMNMNSKLTVSTTVNFTRLTGLGRYGSGYGSENIMTNFRQWWQTNVDIKEQKEAYERDQTNATWNYASPENDDFSPIFWNNPYFVRYKNYENDERYRTFGNVAATYKFADWFNVLGRVTVDSYDEMQEERSAVGSTQASYVPFYSRYNNTYREFNYDLIGNFTKNFNEDFSFQGLIGANLRRQYRSSIFAITNGGLALPEVYALTNTVSPLEAPTETQTSVGVDGIFASATLGYRDRIFLDLTARRDKSTTLRKGNNTFVYPSASLGYVFSETFRETAPWLSYGKARISYAEVGAGTSALNIYDSYRQNAALGNAAISYLPRTKNNEDLVPERTRSGEVGLELSFLENRLGIEGAFYQTNTVNQIIPLRISTATGYNARYVNSGEVRNRGVELTGYVMPVRNDNITWKLAANWTRNRNEVLSLFEGVDNIVLATYNGGVTSNAAVGEAFGVITGTDFVYLNGQKVVDEEGYYLQSSANTRIADPNPKWRGGITNTVTYKGLSLNFLIDIRKGGQVFSLDRYYGQATGLTPETADLNDLGNESRAPIVQNADGSYASNSGGVILPGVFENGQPNNVRVSNTDYGLFGYVYQPNSAFVYDASFVKLREVALSFALPKTLTTRLGFVKGADISVIGRNLWIIHKNLPDADPEESLGSGNLGQGYQVGSYPTTRTIGANLRLSF